MNQAPVMYSSCLKKSRYSTEAKAKRYAELSTKRGGIPIYTYYCRICMGFHLTKRPQNGR